MGLGGNGIVVSDHDDGESLVLIQAIEQFHDAGSGVGRAPQLDMRSLRGPSGNTTSQTVRLEIRTTTPSPNVGCLMRCPCSNSLETE